jgi:hypothetical protein
MKIKRGRFWQKARSGSRENKDKSHDNSFDISVKIKFN